MDFIKLKIGGSGYKNGVQRFLKLVTDSTHTGKLAIADIFDVLRLQTARREDAELLLSRGEFTLAGDIFANDSGRQTSDVVDFNHESIGVIRIDLPSKLGLKATVAADKLDLGSELGSVSVTLPRISSEMGISDTYVFHSASLAASLCLINLDPKNPGPRLIIQVALDEPFNGIVPEYLSSVPGASALLAAFLSDDSCQREEQDNPEKGCRKCGCTGWRSNHAEPPEPELCINSDNHNYPAPCHHTKDDHAS